MHHESAKMEGEQSLTDLEDLVRKEYYQNTIFRQKGDANFLVINRKKQRTKIMATDQSACFL